jgi:hypothetical protein
MTRVRASTREAWRELRALEGLLDAQSDTFGGLGLARMVESPAARLLVLPSDPESRSIALDDSFWAWWDAAHPDPASSDTRKWGRTTRPYSLGALQCDGSPQGKWWQYAALRRDGSLDITLGPDVAFEKGDPPVRVVRLTQLVARLWAGLALYSEAVTRLTLPGPFELSFALLRTRAGVLAGLGREWAEPDSIRGPIGECFEPNVYVRRELPSWPVDLELRTLAFSIGGCVEDAWGIRRRRFLFREGPQAGQFDPYNYRPS